MSDAVIFSVIQNCAKQTEKNNIFGKVAVDGEKYYIVICTKCDVKNVVLSFYDNPYSVKNINVPKKLNIFNDLCENTFSRNLIHNYCVTSIRYGAAQKVISSLELYELLAEKIQYTEYLIALGLMSNVEIIRYSNKKQYVNRYIKFPFVEDNRITSEINYDDFNGHLVCVGKMYDKNNILLSTLIGPRVISVISVINITGPEKYGAEKIKIFCLEVYEAIITMINLLKHKKKSDNRCVDEILMELYNNNIKINDTEKIFMRTILTSLLYDAKKKILDMIKVHFDVTKYEYTLMMDCMTYFKSIYKKEHDIYSGNNNEQYLKLTIALPDNKYYWKLSVVNIEPYYFNNDIGSIIAEYKDYYIN